MAVLSGTVDGRPGEVTSFVGRRREIAEVRNALASSRLVTLTGIGGVGKSRLALRVAENLRPSYRDGVHVAELAELREPSLLAATVAAALEVNEQSARPSEASLAEYLADKQLLLVLDNCEQLTEACAQLVGAVLVEAPKVRVLATSREPLRLRAEQVWPVPPLPADGTAGPGRQQWDAVRLFEERAAATVPGFEVDEHNRAAVTRLCQRLDGLPLAIELAAVWVRALSVPEILARLEELPRLSGSNPDGPTRHRTLRTAFDSSFALCDKLQQMLWQRLSVFAGSFDLQAAEAVCADDDITEADVLRGLAGLVEQSIVTREDVADPPRYRTLETIRDYGREHLRRSGAESQLRHRHRDYYLRLAEEAGADWFGPRQPMWLGRLRLDHANLRSALEFCSTEPEQAGAGLRMAGSLWWYWIGHGLFTEGRHWLERLLAGDSDLDEHRTRALWVDGWLAQVESRSSDVLSILRLCIRQSQQLGDRRALAYATQFLGITEMFRGNRSRGIELLEQAMQQHRSAGECNSVTLLGLAQLGWASYLAGDMARARACFRECWSTCRQHDERWTRSWALWGLGRSRWAQGRLGQATACLQEALRLKQGTDRLGIPFCVEVLAWVAAAERHPRRAATLLGASTALWQPIGTPLFGFEDLLESREWCEASARRALGDRTFTKALRQGARLSFDEIMDFALGEQDNEADSQAATPLTPREHEIAELVAAGHTNRDIAARLAIAPRTVESHVEHILSKLGFASRARIAAWITTVHNGEAS